MIPDSLWEPYFAQGICIQVQCAVKGFWMWLDLSTLACTLVELFNFECLSLVSDVVFWNFVLQGLNTH